MILNVFLVFCGVSTTVKANSARSDRDSLLSLLEQVDSSSNINNLLDRVPIHSFGSLLENRVVTTSPQPRRRHSPCEANDGSGDGYAGDCLTRRFGLLGGVLQSMQTPDSNGITADAGRIQLRSQYKSLQEDYLSMTNLANQIYFNLTNTNNGSLLMVDFAARKLFNKETLMAQSVNNAWMNLINATNLASADIDRILATRDNVTYNISLWFDALQLAEEMTTYNNQQQVLNTAWDALNQQAAAISDSQTQVWSALTSLDDSMGGSEDLSGSLADSLADAADSVDSSLQDFESSISDVALGAETTLNQTLDNLVSSFGTTAQNVISTVQSSASAKEAVAQTASLEEIADQVGLMWDSTNFTQNTSSNAINDLSTARDTFVNLVAQLYTAAQDQINANISNQTADIQARQSAIQDTLNNAEGVRSQIASLITQVSGNEKQAVANSGSSRLSQLNTATSTINNIVASFATKSQSVLQMAQQVSSGAIAAVGTSSQGPLNDLNTQYDQQQTVAANQANQIALDSQSAASSLASSAAAGTNQLANTGGVVNSQVNGVAVAGMNGVAGVANNLPGRVDTSGIAGAGSATFANGQSVTNTAGSDASAAVYNATGEAEGNLADQAANMSATGNAAENIVANTINAMDVFRSYKDIVTSMSSSTGGSIEGSFADASDGVAALAGKLDTMLTSALAKITGTPPPPGGVSPTIASAMAAASRLIAEAEQKMGGSMADLDKDNVLGILGDALGEVGLSGSQFNATMSTLKQQLEDSVTGASADVDSFLGSVSSGASDMISDNMKNIQELKTSSAIQISALDSTQMDKIRAIAANVDALMGNMRNFLTANNPKLFDQVQNLPVVGQKMFLTLNGLREKAYGIRVQAYNAAGVASDANYQSLMNQINDFNSTAFDTLGQIGSQFNTSANGYLSTLMSQINDLATEFQDQANSMKSQLSAIASSASTAEGDLRVTPEGQKVIAQMQTINSQLSAFADQGHSMVMKVSDPAQFSRPANYSNMVSRVIKLTNNAGSSDAFVSSLMSNLSSFATSTLGSANSSVQANNQQAASELSRQTQIAALNAGVAQSQLAARQAAMNQLHGDANQMVADYAQEAKLQAQAQTNKADYVYDSIQGAQADAMNSLGRIAQKYASTMSDGSAQASSNAAASSTAIANLRQQIARMAYLFDGYMQSEQRQYATSEDDRSGFTVALLTDVKRKMSALDNALYQIDQQITNQYNRVNGELISIDSSDLDSEIDALTDQLNAWQNSQSGTLTGLETSASNITASAAGGTTFNYTSIQNQIEKTISIAAQTAVAFIGYYKQPVPANLTAIVNDPVTAFENAYTAAVAR